MKYIKFKLTYTKFRKRYYRMSTRECKKIFVKIREKSCRKRIVPFFLLFYVETNGRLIRRYFLTRAPAVIAPEGKKKKDVTFLRNVVDPNLERERESLLSFLMVFSSRHFCGPPAESPRYVSE